MFDDSKKRQVRDFIVILRSLPDCLYAALDGFRLAMEWRYPTSQKLQWLRWSGCGVPDEAASKMTIFLVLPLI